MLNSDLWAADANKLWEIQIMYRHHG